ncbi:MAG: hypothetical protein AAGI22_28570 [Planctomycetota bacterium]
MQDAARDPVVAEMRWRINGQRYERVLSVLLRRTWQLRYSKVLVPLMTVVGIALIAVTIAATEDEPDAFGDSAGVPLAGQVAVAAGAVLLVLSFNLFTGRGALKRALALEMRKQVERSGPEVKIIVRESCLETVTNTVQARVDWSMFGDLATIDGALMIERGEDHMILLPEDLEGAEVDASALGDEPSLREWIVHRLDDAKDDAADRAPAG